MTIARNEHTVKFGREYRFLIDDPDSGDKLAYLLTKPLKVGKTYNNKGIYSFVLQEVVSTDDDNMELGIADYYKYHVDDADNPGENDVENDDNVDTEGNNENENRKKVWL